MGTSPVTAFIESASGIREGGRTGITACVVGCYMFISLFFTPLLGKHQLCRPGLRIWLECVSFFQVPCPTVALTAWSGCGHVASKRPALPCPALPCPALPCPALLAMGFLMMTHAVCLKLCSHLSVCACSQHPPLRSGPRPAGGGLPHDDERGLHTLEQDWGCYPCLPHHCHHAPHLLHCLW